MHLNIENFGEQDHERSFKRVIIQYFFRGMMIVIARGFISLSVRCFDNGYVGKQPVAWKECCAVYWLKKKKKKLQQSMDRWTCRRDITEILLKMAHSNNQSII